MALQKEKKEHAFQLFEKDFKEEKIPGVLLLCGVEDYLISWASDRLVSRYVNEATRSMDYVCPDSDGENVTKIILEECNTFPMLSDKKIVRVDNYPPLKAVNPRGFSQEDTQALLSYIENPNPESILIFTVDKPETKSEFAKGLKKLCKTYDFESLNYSQLVAFIEKRFKAEKMKISRSTLKCLIDETGYFNKEAEYHIFNLENDLKKIFAYCISDTVTEEDIYATLRGDLDTFIFSFLDSLCSNHKDKAFELMGNILVSGIDEFAVLGSLVTHFEFLLEVKEFREDGLNLKEITEAMHANEYRVKKAMGNGEKFSVAKLKEILCGLYEIDRNVKSGFMDAGLALELLVGRV